MRSAIIAALTSLAIISVASAQDDETISGPSSQAGQTPPPEPGITAEQESKIPYHPCMEAYGWANGRLRCSNSN
jgi:hypothetical protein